MAEELSIFQVDAFTREPFKGNPAAVCFLSTARDESWMQHVAREMNLSETAFLHRRGSTYDLRWFSPEMEVDLCGHATLASAHILWEEGMLPSDETARFGTRSGLLTAVRRGDWIEMDFPAEPESPADPPGGLIEGLGITPRYVGKNRFDYLIEVDSEKTVRDLRPDLAKLATVDMRGVIVTAPVAAANSPYDFVSRFFGPAAGIPEDPVTGSAHCCLALFWGKRLKKDSLVGYQASARGGEVHVAVKGDRVLLSGQAVTVFRGKLAG
jgi:PhzF family phenazine biosynthesis protein